MNPETLLYTKTHEWVHVENGTDGAKIGTVGISDFAIKELTDLVFIDLPKVGRQVIAGQPMGEVESVKAVSDINSPVDGEVVEVNEAVSKNLEVLSQDPYVAGWLVKIRLSNEAALGNLLDYNAYQDQCAQGG